MRTKHYLAAFSVFASIGMIVVGIYTSAIKLPITQRIDMIWSLPYDDMEVLVGDSHNVFVARVLRQIGTEPLLDDFPSTQFEVEIIMNIKGNLEGTAVVAQPGGYKRGILHAVEDGDILVSEQENSEYLLRPGSTYVMATRGDGTRGTIGFYVLNPHASARRVLSRDESLSTEQLRAVAEEDETVRAFRMAYPSEKLSNADVRANIARNSFDSLPPEERERILHEIANMER